VAKTVWRPPAPHGRGRRATCGRSHKRPVWAPALTRGVEAARSHGGVPAAARRILLSLSAVAALALPAPALAACPGEGVAPGDAAAVTATLCLLNEARAAQDLPALVRSTPLNDAADGYARDMVARGFFDHVSPGGGTMMQRIKAAGWVAASGSWTAGENIGWGSGPLAAPAEIVDGWLHSAGHRANILNGDFAEIGIGIAPGAPEAGVPGEAATYVTDFASRGTTTAATAKKKSPVARCAPAKRPGRPGARRCARR
jgi:uncharacterized protein YkwD